MKKKIKVNITTTVKPKNVKSNKPMLVNIILDETGSMGIRKQETISAFNEYVNSLKKLKVNVSISLTKFNSEKVEIVYADKALKDIQLLDDKTYQPDCLTPLYDAVGKTINTIEKKEIKNKSVLVVIITDGQENASKEYKQKQIFDMITDKQKKYGWTFIFMGVDQDAWAASQTIGVLYANTLSVDKNNIKGAMRYTAGATRSYASSKQRAGGMSSTSFFKKQKI